jgi:hypothetical protein
LTPGLKICSCVVIVFLSFSDIEGLRENLTPGLKICSCVVIEGGGDVGLGSQCSGEIFLLVL